MPRKGNIDLPLFPTANKLETKHRPQNLFIKKKEKTPENRKNENSNCSLSFTSSLFSITNPNSFHFHSI